MRQGVQQSPGLDSSISLLLYLACVLLLGSEWADRAKVMAAQQVGPGYRFHVSSLNIARSNQTTSVSGVVIAWNDNEILHLPVQWEER